MKLLSCIFGCNNVFVWVSTYEKIFLNMRIGGVFISEECGLIIASIDFVGTKSDYGNLIYIEYKLHDGKCSI